MKGKICWMHLLIIISIVFLLTMYGEKADAQNSKPPCCLYLKGETPSWLKNSFVTVYPGGFKLPGQVQKVGNNYLIINIFATLDKAEFRETKQEMQLFFDEDSVNIKDIIPGKDYNLLIPLQIYNVYLKPNMFDFVKIRREFLW